MDTPTQTSKPNYKNTLNLPKTDFAMKANLSQNEPLTLKRWDAAGMYETILKSREHAENFVFHDGPPYANGAIHVGHLLNKVLKDIVVRTRTMMGKKCAFIPGWDCHGLPIEHRVMTDMMAAGKAEKLNTLTEDQRRMAVRRECAKYAEKFIKLQAEQMKRLLTLGDYAHPYLTMAKEYEQGVMEVFAQLVEQGLVYRALKPVHWSIANQTALAEAELEYEDREDPSVYVDFEAEDREAVLRAFGLDPDAEGLESTPSFMIWTTTPWTLPANLAIAAHARFKYSLVRVDGSLTVIASELVEKVTKGAKAERVERLAEADGAALVGLKYKHPFCDDSILGKPRQVVSAEYVTLEDGTGLVHTAPGHGTEDYQTGLREGIEIYCPVRGDGTYDDTVPEWLRGKSVWDANKMVMEHLRDSGHLYHSHMFTHSYPHDWRSKTPVIFRSTEQWFIGVEQPLKRGGGTLRSMGLEAAEKKINFVPEWGRNRLRGMLESRPDWCISRQRAWGLPIPAFQTSDGDVFMTAASIRAVGKVFAQRGSDAWFTEGPDKLLEFYDGAKDPDGPVGLKTMDSGAHAGSLTKMHDILDVWFESGSSWNSVLKQRGLGYPADLYLEGSDQHRGWFQASLLPALGVTGEPPYKTLLTHGFIVDKDGRKMSKSLGNTLEVEDLLKQFGADVCRWWVSSLAFENDIKMDIGFFKTAGDSYVKVRNTLRYLLSNLQDFTPEKAVAVGDVSKTSIDGWMLGEAAKLKREVAEAFEKYEFRTAHLKLYDFCNDTLSAVYCVAVKDRLYCDKADSRRRRTTQTVMWQIAELLCRLLAPIVPHTADEAYRSLWKDDSRSVHLTSLDDVKIDYAADAGWAKVMEACETARKALESAKAAGIENPLDAEVVLPDPKKELDRFKADLADLLGVSRVKLDAAAEEGAAASVVDLRSEPRCERSWRRDGTVKERADGGMLSDRDWEAVQSMAQ
ncbi:MAG TPA: isoleucine--tRNA ligase [Phycisphaerales bacterium]|nr:isoleucine--tRNA ligase [Phycisphaerales bacterium]